MTDIVPVEQQQGQIQVQRKQSLFDLQPQQQIAYASTIATALRDVIEKQKLYSEIQGKKYVKVEGWTTLGVMLGILPAEDWVKEHEDGSFEAKVNLIRQNDGLVVGSATALCGMDEKRWRSAEKFARRSMAITRATGKAFRLGLSWILSMAGYEPTPYEEMPIDVQATPEIERYTATKPQKKRLFDAALKAGIQKTEIAYLAAMSDEFQKGKGLEMDYLEAAIAEYMSEHPRSQDAAANHAQ